MSVFSKMWTKDAPDSLRSLDDDASFFLRVAQTASWCLARSPTELNKDSFRSDQLRPRILERDRTSVVQGVLSTRAFDPIVRDARAAQTHADLRGGRLLVCFPDAEIADGAAEAETNGFFDSNDAPPWDTWVGLFADPDPEHQDAFAVYLVAWVAAPFIDAVQRGIETSVLDNIAWLEATKTGLAERLHREGFWSTSVPDRAGSRGNAGLTSVAAVKGMKVRCVTAQHSALLRSQLIHCSLCRRTRR